MMQSRYHPNSHLLQSKIGVVVLKHMVYIAPYDIESAIYELEFLIGVLLWKSLETELID